MTISKGTTLSITAGVSYSCIGAFSSSQAGVVYGRTGTIVSGFLLNISGTTITKAGAESDLHTVGTGPIQRAVISEVSSTNLRLLTVDSNQVVEIVPVTKTATQLAGGVPNTLSFPAGLDLNTFWHTANNWDGDTFCTISKWGTSTWYLTLANDVSQGNVISFTQSQQMSIQPVFAPFDASSGIMFYWKGGATNNLMGVRLTKSGLTLSAGTPFTVNTTNRTSGNGLVGACPVSSTRVAAGHIDVLADRRIQTIDSPTTVNADTVIAATDAGMLGLERFHSGSIVAKSESVTTTFWSELTVAGAGSLTHTNTVSNSGTSISSLLNTMARLDNSRIISTIGDSSLSTVIISTDVPPPGATTDEFSTGGLVAKPVDIDADGDFLYISVLDSLGEPGLIKFSTALNADGARIFEPGAGNSIGVQCGRRDADIVWIAGNFGGTDTVEKSEDAGSSFVVKDPGTFDPVVAFNISPESDEHILAATNLGSSAASGTLQLTLDDGATWTEINGNTASVVTDIAQLDINPQEAAFGGESPDEIDYGVSYGQNLEDISGGGPTSDTTKVIIG